jgi:NADH-quinone oxidoreductase subunit C
MSDGPNEDEKALPTSAELEAIILLLKREVHEQAVAEAYVNELNGDMPTTVIAGEHWLAAAELLKRHERLGFNYLRNVSGVDYETYLEVVYHLVSLGERRELAVKVKTERERPSVASVTPIWATANWNEREIFDLLGVDFPGHPDLRRIMMPDDWAGYPLRKDYEPLDPEV